LPLTVVDGDPEIRDIDGCAGGVFSRIPPIGPFEFPRTNMVPAADSITTGFSPGALNPRTGTSAGEAQKQPLHTG